MRTIASSSKAVSPLRAGVGTAMLFGGVVVLFGLAAIVITAPPAAAVVPALIGVTKAVAIAGGFGFAVGLVGAVPIYAFDRVSEFISHHCRRKPPEARL